MLTGQELPLRFEEPKERELSAAQRTWRSRHLDHFEKALYGRRFREPSDGYSSYIEVESFIDFHWMVEISKNADGYWLSHYMHKDRGKRLTMGPLWDWDNTFDDEIGELKRWVGSRLAWIGSQSFPQPEIDMGRADEADKVGVRWRVGRCFCTLDGSDPRARGGSVSPSAREYSGPIHAGGRAALIRVRSSFGLWSPPVVVRGER